MKLKMIWMFILTSASFFSFNAFGYLYGVKLTVNNNTNDELFLGLLSLSKININQNQPFISEYGVEPHSGGVFPLHGNSDTIVYLDNFDWSGRLYQTKYINFSVFKVDEDPSIPPISLSRGKIFIVTGATMWNMYAYFDSEYPLVYIPQYRVEATPDYKHSKYDTAGNLAELTLTIYNKIEDID